MKKLLFSLLAVGFILTSCGGTSPTKFNDAIVKANTNISNVGGTYMNTLSAALSSSSYDGIAAVTDSALVKIDAELAIVKALEVPKGGESYKDAAVKTYESLRAFVESGKKFSTLTKDSSVEDINNVSAEYEAKMKVYTDSFDELTKAQVAYAEEAGYKIEN
ncbi:hypothetical protein D0T84_15245 [Dysgonomonas sp. 521]|uniref:hypothetical protein n=1 Tax=Dysgonomonas sp. 521 TaxID=2302932 RepID=UPI0013D1B5AB|nr:hypothetical protein [Dysgonomonas sp. 521]NDV96256.1 hypothetical protein [Dysgonomonas sp. 521]